MTSIGPTKSRSLRTRVNRSWLFLSLVQLLRDPIAGQSNPNSIRRRKDVMLDGNGGFSKRPDPRLQGSVIKSDFVAEEFRQRPSTRDRQMPLQVIGQ